MSTSKRAAQKLGGLRFVLLKKIRAHDLHPFIR
ncbi:MAG: hypothetical protein JWM39_716 [Parcubacteria group bacterium]|nr:hypothetical protein [Parcubacteria group bacterium]